MKGKPFEIGRVVVSKQGHDKGRWFVVMKDLDEKHVLIADGRTRLLEKPKKKQTKHLRWKPYLAESVAQGVAAGEDAARKPRQGMPLQNSDLRKGINAFMAQEWNPAQATGETRAHQKEECALVQK